MVEPGASPEKVGGSHEGGNELQGGEYLGGSMGAGVSCGEVFGGLKWGWK